MSVLTLCKHSQHPLKRRAWRGCKCICGSAGAVLPCHALTQDCPSPCLPARPPATRLPGWSWAGVGGVWSCPPQPCLPLHVMYDCVGLESSPASARWHFVHCTCLCCLHRESCAAMLDAVCCAMAVAIMLVGVGATSQTTSLLAEKQCLGAMASRLRSQGQGNSVHSESSRAGGGRGTREQQYASWRGGNEVEEGALGDAEHGPGASLYSCRRWPHSQPSPKALLAGVGSAPRCQRRHDGSISHRFRAVIKAAKHTATNSKASRPARAGK